MRAAEAAHTLAELATLGELRGENAFRVRAFANAARALEASDADLTALAAAGELTTLAGVGEGIAEILSELVSTGRSTLADDWRASTPPGLYALLTLPGLGAKRVHRLHAELGIDSLDALEAAAGAGRVAKLSGFGAKTEQKLLEGLAFARSVSGFRRYPKAMELATALVEWVRARGVVKRAEIVGALRRRMEVVNAVELLAACESPDSRAALLREFRDRFGAEGEAEEAEPGRARVMLADGLTLALRVVDRAAWAAALVWETGSAEHLAALAARAEERGLRLEQDGLYRGETPLALAEEPELYAALGLPYVPPELREGMGEVAAAATGALPRLVETSDLRGTFHCHSTYSDGKATLAEMAEAAHAKGWAYLGIADHSKSAAYAGGLSVAAVKKQHAEIDALNRGFSGQFRLFKGTESDILPDGRLDYPDELLKRFDYVVGSVHSSFQMGEREMTERIMRAIENPHLTMLGHATGRILLRREGYAVNVREVIDAAAEHGVAIEINADPSRLDLDWRHLRYAAQKGVLIPINPDAHSTAGLDNVAFGVGVARKGWLTAHSVLNTWTLDEVERYFAERKQTSA